MKKLFKLTTSFLGIFAIFSNQAAQAATAPTMEATETGYDNYTIMSANCQMLLDLENQSSLSVNQEVVGQIVFDIVNQISENPIEYCNEIQMAQVIEEDPETLMR